MGRVTEAQQELQDKGARYAVRHGLEIDEATRREWELRALWQLAVEQEQDIAQEQQANAALMGAVRELRARLEAIRQQAPGPVYISHSERVPMYPDGRPQGGLRVPGTGIGDVPPRYDDKTAREP